MKYLLCILVFIDAISYSQSFDPLSKVNSPYDELNPVVSLDGKTLYLSIANHPKNIGGKKDPGDIWISVMEDHGWSVPVHGGSTLNNTAFNGVAAVSKNGNELYLVSHYKANGSAPSTQGISLSRRTTAGWSVPQNIIMPYFLNRSATLSGHGNQDLSVFVFSAEGYNTIGAEDVYVSIKRDGSWTELINLGTNINTSFQELSPSFSADGSKLYFASNGRKSGLGSFDIYMSNRLDDTWTSWSEPVNLGKQINSEGRELYFREFSALGFSLYTSTRNSDGYGDVRILKDSLVKQPIIEIKIPVVEVPSVLTEANTINISGRVINSRTGEAIPARLTFNSDSVYRAGAGMDGIYSIGLKPAKVYAIEIEAVGFVNLSEKLDIKSIALNNIEMNFKLQPIEVGAVINLKSVLFEIGTTSLLEESYSELNVVVDFLATNPKVEIELEGHTDNRGDTKKNLVLSQQRVDKIKSYLVSKGVSARRIKGKGFGGTRPIATNDTDEARKLNRRVEFRILKN